MGIMDGITGALGQQAISAVAAKLGIDPSMAATAIGALTNNHGQACDTIQQSAQQTGLSPDILSQVVGTIGGTGGLGALVGALTGGGAVADPQQPAEAAPDGGGLGGILAGLTGGGAGGGLGGIASMLDRDGDGNPLDDIMGMLGKK